MSATSRPSESILESIRSLRRSVAGHFLSIDESVLKSTAKFEAEDVLKEVAEFYFDLPTSHRAAAMRMLLSSSSQ
jgi:hypothetical protein